MAADTRQENTTALARMALCAAALCAAAYLSCPLPFTPIVLSALTVAVNLTALLLTPRQAVGTVAVYLLMGLVGLPVFAGGTAGAGKLFGPTGGFYWSFLPAVAAIGALRGRRVSAGRYCLVTAAVGLPIQHLCAVAMMWAYTGGSLWAVVGSVSLPFLLPDLAKCILASVIAAAVQRKMTRG